MNALIEFFGKIGKKEEKPGKSFLRGTWKQIMDLISDLRYEPYIDDQVQIEEIWNIVKALLKRGGFEEEPWEVKEHILEAIYENDYYDYYGVYDPMRDLANAVCSNKEENLKRAAIMMKAGRGYLGADAARLYRELGEEEKCAEYFENHLGKEEEPYLIVIDYYKSRNHEKAVETANLAIQKCKKDQTPFFLFLLQDARDRGEYFTINRARQYEKTTTLRALKRYLQEEYIVVSLDFQKLDAAKFQDGNMFSLAFASYFIRLMKKECVNRTDEVEELLEELREIVQKGPRTFTLFDLFENLSQICGAAERPVVMMIDEVDSAANNQVFLDFLAQLRGYYIDRDEMPIFQSVILAGVYDIKSLKLKIRIETEHQTNSPWNIAANFDIDMSLSENGIAADEKNQFIVNGQLDMELVLQKFVSHYTELFGEYHEHFLEDNGRCIFLLYMKPIINGTGNYYIESKTRTNRRTDLIIDFCGQQKIIELKIWHGEEYNRRGEEQLTEYLEEYHLKRGYMVSFNFNKKKQIGIHKIVCRDKVLIEAVV